MICSRCNSERSHQFATTKAVRSRPEPNELPLVCLGCGLMTIDGTAVNLPEELEKAARGMAEAQAAEVEKARAGLEDAPDDRVELYMKKFFKTAYLEGFFRALAFFRHDAKEGRLVRLRELWSDTTLVSNIVPGKETRRGVMMGEAAYTEFEQLLSLNVVLGDLDAKSDTNKRSTKQENRSHLP